MRGSFDDMRDRSAAPSDARSRPRAREAGLELGRMPHLVEQPGEAGAALVGNQHHPVAAGFELGGKGMGWDHVSAGAAGGENEIHPGHGFIEEDPRSI